MATSAVTQTDYGWSDIVHTLQCPSCNFQTLNYLTFREHCVQTHENLTSVLIYSCPLCRASATDIRLIAEHKALYHAADTLQAIPSTQNSSIITNGNQPRLRVRDQSPRGTRNRTSDISSSRISLGSQSRRSARRSSCVRRKSRSSGNHSDSLQHHPLEESRSQAPTSIRQCKSSPSDCSDDGPNATRKTIRKSSIKAIAAMTAAIVSITAPDSPPSVLDEEQAPSVEEEPPLPIKRRRGRPRNPSLERKNISPQNGSSANCFETPVIKRRTSNASTPPSRNVGDSHASVSILPVTSHEKKGRGLKRCSSSSLDDTLNSVVSGSSTSVKPNSSSVVEIKKRPIVNKNVVNHAPVIKSRSPIKTNTSGIPATKFKQEKTEHKRIRERRSSDKQLCSEVRSHIQHLFERGIRKPSTMLSQIRKYVLSELRPSGIISQNDRYYFPSLWNLQKLLQKMHNKEKITDIKPTKSTSKAVPIKRRRTNGDNSHQTKLEPRASNTAVPIIRHRTFADLVSNSNRATTSSASAGGNGAIPISELTTIRPPENSARVQSVKLEESRLELVRCVKCGIRVPFQSDGTRASQDAALMAHLANSHGIRKREPIVYPTHHNQQSSSGELGLVRRRTASSHVTDLDAGELSSEEPTVKVEEQRTQTSIDGPSTSTLSQTISQSDVRILKECEGRQQQLTSVPVKSEYPGLTPEVQVTATRFRPPSGGDHQVIFVKQPPAEDLGSDIELTTVRLRGPLPSIKTVPKDDSFPGENTVNEGGRSPESGDVDIDQQEMKDIEKSVEMWQVKNDEDQNPDGENGKAELVENEMSQSPKPTSGTENEATELADDDVIMNGELKDISDNNKMDSEEQDSDDVRIQKEVRLSGDDDVETDLANQKKINTEPYLNHNEDLDVNEDGLDSKMKAISTLDKDKMEEGTKEFGENHQVNDDAEETIANDDSIEDNDKVIGSKLHNSVEDVTNSLNDHVTELESTSNHSSICNDRKKNGNSLSIPGVVDISAEDGDENWQCEYCFAGFDDEDELNAHLLELHP